MKQFTDRPTVGFINVRLYEAFPLNQYWDNAGPFFEDPRDAVATQISEFYNE